MKSIKTFTIFAGINGAGKSTLYNSLTTENLGVRLNSDEIVASNGWDWKDVKAQINAGKELIYKEKDCLNKRLSFNRETTLSGYSILKSIEEAKKLGYKIVLYYVGVASSEIAKERVKNREKKGGHGVSDETVERRFHNSRDNLKAIFSMCDEIYIYENSVFLFEACRYNGAVLTSDATGWDWKNNKNLDWVKKLIQEVFPNYSPAFLEQVSGLKQGSAENTVSNTNSKDIKNENE